MQNLKNVGQIEALTVEGPDDGGYYFLIDGYRRLEAMGKCPDKFAVVKCQVLRSLTSTKDRNKTRLFATVNSKRTINLENQIMVEAIDDPLIFGQLPYSKRRRILRGMEIPKKERIRVAQNRLSQEAF